MTTKIKRSKRRFQKVLQKKKAVKILKSWGCKCTPSEIGKIARTKTPCSCPMCGNPRKYFKDRTIQELKKDSNNETKE